MKNEMIDENGWLEHGTSKMWFDPHSGQMMMFTIVEGIDGWTAIDSGAWIMYVNEGEQMLTNDQVETFGVRENGEIDYIPHFSLFFLPNPYRPWDAYWREMYAFGRRGLIEMPLHE